jgi:hypothetical protein
MKLDEWRLINTAPKDGSIIIGKYDNVPVFMAWVDLPDTLITKIVRKWIFKKSITEYYRSESGWRILALGSDLAYYIHGNFGPFNPSHWLPWDNLFQYNKLKSEVERLSKWLEKIEGGDSPCTDEAQLRQWAYSAVTLSHKCTD